jgi:WD40 repeat protein
LDGKDIIRLPHSGHVTGIQFSPDGARLITASTDAKIRIFDVPDFGRRVELDAGTPVRLLTMSPDGNWIAVAADGHKILSWDMRTKDMRTNLPVPDFIGRAPGSAIAFDPDSHWIAAGMSDGSFRILKQDTRENLFGDRKIERGMYQILFSPDRRWLAVAGEDHTARIYDVATGVESGRILHASDVKSVAFTADSAFLVSGSADGLLAVSPVVSSTEEFRHRNGDTSAVAISPGKRLVAVPTFSHGISLFTLAPTPRRSILHGADDMVKATFSDKGDLLLSADEHFRATIFDLTPPDDKDKESPFKRVARQSMVKATNLSHDAQLFAVAEDSGTVSVYYAQKTGEREFDPIRYPHPAKALAFSGDNQLLATGNSDGTAHIYQRYPAGPVENWKELPIRPLTSRGEVIAVTFNPAASRLAYGSSLGLVKVCKVTDGSISIEVNYLERVVALAFTADGSLLAVALGNGLVHLLRTDSGEEIGIIENHERGVRSISIDESDKSLWTTSIGDSDDLVSRFVAVRKFPLYQDELIRKSCELLKSFPEEKARAHVAFEEPDHHVCE